MILISLFTPLLSPILLCVLPLITLVGSLPATTDMNLPNKAPEDPNLIHLRDDGSVSIDVFNGDDDSNEDDLIVQNATDYGVGYDATEIIPGHELDAIPTIFMEYEEDPSSDDGCPADDDEPPDPVVIEAETPLPSPSNAPPSDSTSGGDNSTALQRPRLSKRDGVLPITLETMRYSLKYYNDARPDVLTYLAQDRKWYPVQGNVGMQRATFVNGRNYNVLKFPSADNGHNMFFMLSLGEKKGYGRMIVNRMRNGQLDRPDLIHAAEAAFQGRRSPYRDPMRAYIPANRAAGSQGKCLIEDGRTEPQATVQLAYDNTRDVLLARRDSMGVALCYWWNQKVLDTIPVSDRTAVFFTDAGNSEQMRSLIRTLLRGRGYSYFDVFGGRRTDRLYPPRRYDRAQRFMGIYRGSRAIAQENRSPNVYVILQRVVDDGRHRNIFDDVEKKWDPNSIGVGQVWAQIELPTLMRNPFVRRIHVAQQGPKGTWYTETQWEFGAENAFPVDHVPLMSLDDRTSVPQLPGTKH